jgi:hypothetical protein
MLQHQQEDNTPAMLQHQTRWLLTDQWTVTRRTLMQGGICATPYVLYYRMLLLP